MADDTNARSATAKKAPAREASARTAPPRKAPSDDGARSGSERDGRPPKASQVAGLAARQLGELIGKEVEGVVGLERSDAGWKVLVEVLELRRVPTTTDVLATYEVSVDTSGDLEGYRRLQRYARGATRDE